MSPTPQPMLRGLCVPMLLISLFLTPLTGCSLWPWDGKERTTIITPSMRAASIREMGVRGRDSESEQQTRICEQLAQQIRTEPDPIVRLAIQETVSEFKTAPLAKAMLLAGLNDEDRDVKVACCRMLGERKETAAIGPLAKLVSQDSELDVRLAAVDALGAMKTKESIAGLAAALKDRDPAMQYAGVEAMKKVSDQKLGNDVQAWRAYADGVVGPAPAASIATQPAETTVK